MQSLRHRVQAGGTAHVIGPHVRHLRARTGTNRRHAITKVTGIDDQHGIARFQQVGHGQFHGQRARAGHHEGLAVGRDEHVTQLVQGVAEDFDEIGCHVAGCRLGHRGQHVRLELDGAGNHQQLARRVNAGRAMAR